ncbi:glycosyl hydrolase family 76-domain-containing protein [Calycina marina]|uniref:Mannan endo-1,6-alpha-mannosidase n=1 Tax=Calycina marina TaxID=1763456 RepID=A0A9P7Z9T3_9HELO|nr:glycosyl hydrolase family 76-domain-containing protein [Calycina marina]
MRLSRLPCATALLAACVLVKAEIIVDLDDSSSIRSAASTVAYDMMSYYSGNTSGGIIGVLPGPPPNPADGYYWWESGAMWGTLVDYWHYTGDSSYNDVLQAGVLAQVGENKDMMPSNWSQSMGNDDQGFWGMTVMAMAEAKFPDPPEGQPGWLELAQAVFNTQNDNKGHDDACGGGLRWQTQSYLTGYDYKNSIANGCFFNIGVRLARYTNNDTYAQIALKSYDWVQSIGLMDATFKVYDGAHITTNCTDVNKVQFSYNVAIFLLGAANMYNYTTDDQRLYWKTQVDGLLGATLEVFFPNGIAYEVACEPQLTCTTDMFSFKAYLLRWMATTAILAPYTADQILPVLRTSAVAAAKQCTGGTNQRACGLSWASGTFDGETGVGQEMATLAAMFVNLQALETIVPPLTNATGGTSQGNVNAGVNVNNDLTTTTPATTADRAGAGIVTTIVLVSVSGMFGWMSI